MPTSAQLDYAIPLAVLPRRAAGAVEPAGAAPGRHADPQRRRVAAYPREVIAGRLARADHHGQPDGR